jgi:hypothetical protein
MKKDVLQQLSDATVVVLCAGGDTWPRALLSATLVPHGWIALVERPDGRRRFVPAGDDPKPQHDETLLLVRNRPITVPLDAPPTRAADGFDVSGACELLVRWQARDDDLAALHRARPGTEVLTLDGLARWVADGGAAAALRDFIRQQPAARLVHDDLRDELLAHLQNAMQRFAFAAGMTLERLPTLAFTSPGFTRHEALQRETAARVAGIESRALVEQAALAATQRRLDDLGGVLAKLEAVAAGDEGMQWRDLLPALAPAERGKLLENLWRLTPDRQIATAVVVVAGQECIWLAPEDPTQIVRRLALPDDLGGLRSATICPQRDELLVGAATGVWVLGAADGAIRNQFAVPAGGRPRTGFNAAAITADKLFATHSQLGAWCWPLAEPDRAEVRLQPAGGAPRTIRAATATADGRVAVAADNRVHLLAAGPEWDEVLPAAPGVIQCLAADGSTLYAGTADGELLSLRLDGADNWVRIHRLSAALESIQPRRWNDLLELVIPAGTVGVCGIYAEEGVVARLMDTPVAVRRAWACDDLLVALSDYRDRLIVMRGDAADRLGRDVPIGRMLGHSVQDACIVSAPAGRDPANTEGSSS